MERMERDEHNRPVKIGFVSVGVISLVGGILMFAYAVPKDMDTGGVPRDVNIIFTTLYSQQGLMHNELKRYAAALSQAGIDEATCQRYRCLLSVSPEGKDYEFRLSKDGKTWAIRSNSPVPKEVTQ